MKQQTIDASVIINLINPGIFGLELTLGGCFPIPPPTVTLLSVKLCDPNLVQRYLGITPIFWDKKNQDQMDNDVTKVSS